MQSLQTITPSTKSHSAFEMRRAILLEGIQKERAVHKLVEELVNCGVRPKIIFQITGRQMSLREIRRIHDAASPIDPSERHGRYLKFENIHKLESDANSIYLQCFKLVETSMKQGASKANALCSAWRIIADRNNCAAHESIFECTAEEMIILFLNFEVSEISVRTCPTCVTPFLRSKAFTCYDCTKQSHRLKLAA